MAPSTSRLGSAIVALVAGASVLSGCGGASGSTVSGGTSGSGGGSVGTGGGALVSSNSASTVAATFQVNVSSGNVSIVSPFSTVSGSAKAKPGMFTGNSVGFSSSVLSNDPLQTGLRSLSVSLVNNTDIPMGETPSGQVTGVNVIFGAFANTTGVQSQTSNTNVSTFAGTTSGFADGATTVAKLNSTAGVAVGANGSVYVGDYGNDRIRKISSGFVSTLAGTGTAAELDGAATKAEFDGPYGVAVNPVDGSVIVADYTGNTVRRVTAAGVVNTVAGKALTAGSTNGAGSAAEFTNPSEVAVDSLGNIYVAESTSNRIRKIALTGSNPALSSSYTVTTYAGNGTAGLLDGNGIAAEFNRPYGLATDLSNNLYVADYNNNVIRMIDPSANVTTIAGTDVQSDLDAYGNAATLNHPFGVAYQNGALYVSEYGGDLVREVMQIPGGGNTSTSWVVETLAGTGSAGDANGAGNSATFKDPECIAASPASSLYVADFGNSQIRRVNPSTGTFPIGAPSGSTNTIGGEVSLSNATGLVDSSDLGQAPYITYNLSSALAPGASSPAQPWNFVIPQGVTSFQFQVIVEANTSELIPLQVAMNAGSPLVDVRNFVGAPNDPGYVDGTATSARLQTYQALACDGSGNLFMADYVSDSIMRVDPEGNLHTIAGTSSLGLPGSANGTGAVAQFANPTGITVNSAGTEIFIADSQNNEIRRMALTSGSDPTDPANWTVTTIIGSTSPGYANGAGSAAAVYGPYAITMSGGVLYFTESLGNRIRSASCIGGDRSLAGNWSVQLVAGSDTQTQGTPGLVNMAGGQARFDDPVGIVADQAGNLYVSDFENYVVRKIDPSGNNVSTFAGNQTGASVDGPATSAGFAGPTGLALDSAGYLYVADQGGYVRRIAPNGYVETVAGTGTIGSTNGPGSTAALHIPWSLAFGPSGQLYLGNGDTCIREIQTVISSAAGQARPK